MLALATALVAAAVLVAAAPVRAAAPPAGSPARAEVLAMECAEVDGRTTITIALTAPASWASFLLAEPDRLVVDIDGAVLGSPREPIQVGDGVVDRVRIAQFSPSVVRVVVDLCRSSAYSVTRPEDRPDHIVIAFPQRVTGMRLSDADGRTLITIEGTGKLKYKTAPLLNPPRIVVDLPGTVLAVNATAHAVSNAVVRQVRMSQFLPDTVRVVVDLSRDTTYAVSTSSDKPGEVVVDLGYRIVGVTTTTNSRCTRVQIESSGRPQVKLTRLVDPHRIVLDFEDSVLDCAESTIVVGDDVVDRIRLAQFGPMTVRAVLDLPYYVGHSLMVEGESDKVAIEVARSPVYGKTLVIDPGHGGTDPGTIGPTGLHEKAVVLDISKCVAALLQEVGARVILTRTEDVTMFLPDRVAVATEVRADAFVSVHANAGMSDAPTGTETLYCSTVPMSRKLAEHVQESLVRQIRLPDRGVRERPDLYVIREARMPSCLVEVLFMSNLSEELLLMDEGFRAKAATGIADGIKAYFQWRLETEMAAAAAAGPSDAQPQEARRVEEPSPATP